MVKLGYKLMAEEHGPSDLVANAVAAENAGFDFAAISDHFFPWVEEQGHSPFAWTVLGAIAQATRRMDLMTAVTCPILRYHPAIIAQATATLALLSNDRFALGLGSGERLNEHVVGMGWPGVAERHERFREAIDIIQGLLTGELTDYRGQHLHLENAKLYDLPKKKPRVVIAAGGPKAAALAGEQGDALIATEPKEDLVKAYEKAGGRGARYAEVSVCFAKSEAEGRKTAHKYFRWSLGGWPVQAELPNPRSFDAASAQATPEAMGEKIPCGPDIETHVAAISKYLEAGFDHIIITQIGPEQHRLIEAFEQGLADALRSRAKAA
jgi:G6PDH family F420-dependent oxidoreductase